MTRTQKIEALLEQLLDKGYFSYEDCLKSCILAGIALRDEELLAMEFDKERAKSDAVQFIKAIKVEL